MIFIACISIWFIDILNKYIYFGATSGVMRDPLKLREYICFENKSHINPKHIIRLAAAHNSKLLG